MRAYRIYSRDNPAILRPGRNCLALAGICMFPSRNIGALPLHHQYDHSVLKNPVLFHLDRPPECELDTLAIRRQVCSNECDAFFWERRRRRRRKWNVCHSFFACLLCKRVSGRRWRAHARTSDIPLQGFKFCFSPFLSPYFSASAICFHLAVFLGAKKCSITTETTKRCRLMVLVFAPQSSDHSRSRCSLGNGLLHTLGQRRSVIEFEAGVAASFTL